MSMVSLMIMFSMMDGVHNNLHQQQQPTHNKWKSVSLVHDEYTKLRNSKRYLKHGAVLEKLISVPDESISPGNKPVSAIPKKNRTASNPAPFLIAAEHATMIPVKVTNADIHRLGPIFLSTRLLGT